MKVEFKLRSSENKVFVISADDRLNIGCVKALIAIESDIGPAYQRLLYRGHDLNDDSTRVKHLQVNGNVMHIVERIPKVMETQGQKLEDLQKYAVCIDQLIDFTTNAIYFLMYLTENDEIYAKVNALKAKRKKNKKKNNQAAPAALNCKRSPHKNEKNANAVKIDKKAIMENMGFIHTVPEVSQTITAALPDFMILDIFKEILHILDNLSDIAKRRISKIIDDIDLPNISEAKLSIDMKVLQMCVDNINYGVILSMTLRDQIQYVPPETPTTLVINGIVIALPRKNEAPQVPSAHQQVPVAGGVLNNLQPSVQRRAIARRRCSAGAHATTSNRRFNAHRLATTLGRRTTAHRLARTRTMRLMARLTGAQAVRNATPEGITQPLVGQDGINTGENQGDAVAAQAAITSDAITTNQIEQIEAHDFFLYVEELLSYSFCVNVNTDELLRTYMLFRGYESTSQVGSIDEVDATKQPKFISAEDYVNEIRSNSYYYLSIDHLTAIESYDEWALDASTEISAAEDEK